MKPDSSMYYDGHEEFPPSPFTFSGFQKLIISIVKVHIKLLHATRYETESG
jgi:hypothetical protein